MYTYVYRDQGFRHWFFRDQGFRASKGVKVSGGVAVGPGLWKIA